MKKLYIITGLLLFGISVRAQDQITNFGNIRLFGGTSLTTFGNFNNTGTLTVDSAVTLNNIGSLVNSGAISNLGTFVYSGSATLTYDGLSQQTIGKELPISGGPSSLIINNSNGVVLGIDATINNLTFTSGNLLIDGRTLTINGNVSNSSGTITGGANANLNFAGNSSTIIFDQTSSSTRTLNNFTVNKTGSTLTLGSAVEVNGNLNLNNGTLATGGNLKLNSNATGTSTIPAITGTGAITGNVTVERYVPSSARRWRFISSNVMSSTLEDWRGEIFITGAGVGTSVGYTNSNGFDATISNAPSVYSYDEAVAGSLNSGWVTPSSTNTSLVVGKGYRVFIRGDRSSLTRLTGVDNSQNAVTMNLIGGVNTGDITMPVTYTNNGSSTDDGWNLLGNPYPSPYNWDSYWNSGNLGFNGTFYSKIDPTIYIWDASSNTYKSYNALSSSGTISAGIIASGQGFMMKATGVSPSLIFKEQFKSSSIPTQLFKTKQNDELQISLTLDSINNDLFILKHNANASFLDDVYDIKKWANPTVNISSYDKDSIFHTLDARPIAASNDTINLNVTGSNGTLKLFVKAMPANGKYYYLQDLYLSNTIHLFENTTYSFTIQSSIIATFGLSRFRIIISDNNSLPVAFGKFEATKNQKQVQLNWNTLTENNSSRFEIERSNDQGGFLSIGVLEAKGNSSTLTNYQFIDAQPSFSTINYYRIKQIDLNGNYTYSNIRDISFLLYPSINSTNISLYPNPAKDKLSISSSQVIKGDCKIYLYSVNGNLVKQFQAIQSTSNEFEINLTGISEGFYFIKFIDPIGNIITEKLFVQ
ncbi:MAG: T9SS type A sorting domain-containing protein [Bacteroidota bacterium]